MPSRCYFEHFECGPFSQVGDRQEVGAIVDVFCEGRTAPLLIGALKSNIGHGEPASALSAVVKVLVAMECRLLPPNLHYNVPNPDIPALVDGRLSVSRTRRSTTTICNRTICLKVVTKVVPWDGGIVAVNSFGVGGANGHCLMKSYTQQKKQPQILEEQLPRLVVVSARNESAAERMIIRVRVIRSLVDFRMTFIFPFNAFPVRLTNCPETRNFTLCCTECRAKTSSATNTEDTFCSTGCTTKLAKSR